MEENIKEQQTVSIVVLGYNIAPETLETLLKHHEQLKELKFSSEEISIKIENGQNVPKEWVDNITKQFPVKTYSSEDSINKITYILPEQKFIIEQEKFDIENCRKFKEICKNLIEDYSTNIFTLGLNFSVIYKLDHKLKIFNNDIKNIENWENNIGFQLILPISLDKNVIATYNVSKVKEKTDQDTDIKYRWYKVDVNFNYNLEQKNNKTEDINNFIDTQFDSYYKQFIQALEIILSIGQDTNE